VNNVVDDNLVSDVVNNTYACMALQTTRQNGWLRFNPDNLAASLARQ
jgi:hypothetical protein